MPKSKKDNDIRENTFESFSNCAVLNSSIQLNGTPNQQTMPDYGTMSIGALNKKYTANTSFTLPVVAESFSNQNISTTAKAVLEGPLLNSICTKHTIRGGQTISADFIIGWHFANFLCKST